MFINKRKQYRLKSDEELVALHKSEGGSVCIGILYERYGHLVMGACVKYLKNTLEAEDMTMHIFENLGQKLQKHEIQYFKSWLYMVTKNECFMSLRKKGYEFSPVEMTTIKEEENDLDKILLKEQKISLLEEVIPLLKTDQRKCIELFYLKEMSYQQISEELNLSLMQIKSAIQNGKRNLKIQLEERNEFKSNQ
jgi:RNA polymerase sigma-70 factor (ECF subfamily)